MLIVDTGAIVALLDRRDELHDEARARFGAAARPWHTCEAVIAESFFLLQRAKGGHSAFLALLGSTALTLSYSMRGDETAVATKMRKYAEVPMSVADACLVRMCEVNKGARLLTFDRDFHIYRLHNRRQVPLF